MRLLPREELVQIEIKSGCDSSSGIEYFLDNGVFHIRGLVRSSDVPITGM